MRIIGTTKLSTPCIWTAIGKGIEGLEKLTNIPVTMYDHEDFLHKTLKPSNDEIIFIFEAGFGQKQHTGWDLIDLKRIWPNSVFIALASDTPTYIHKLHRPQLDFNLVDLFLELDPKYAKLYSHLTKTDVWDWTISQYMIDLIGNNNKIDHHYDFIGVYHPDSLKRDGWRKWVLSEFEKEGLRFTNGGGNGHDDNDIGRLISYYSDSLITLGTTSDNIGGTPWDRHACKGFRDWIGPFCGSVLIYDDSPYIMQKYGDVVPYYEYKNIHSIFNIYTKLIKDNQYREQLLKKQRDWARQNTIDIQLFNLLHRHNFI